MARSLLLSVDMRNADYLLQLMKQQIDALVAQTITYKFLTWGTKTYSYCSLQTRGCSSYILPPACTLALVSGNLT